MKRKVFFFITIIYSLFFSKETACEQNYKSRYQYSRLLQYPYRDIEQPIISLDENVRIIQCSPARTGSTLIFNILHYLFEDNLAYHENRNPHLKFINKKVIKSHDSRLYNLLIKKYQVFVVSTIRHPLESLASRIQFYHISFETPKFDAVINHLINEYRIIKEMEKSIPKDRMLVLKYEKMKNDQFEEILEEIETFFSIKINHEEKENIMRYFCLESINQLSKKFPHSSSCDLVTGIHGNHISPLNWQEVIPQEYLAPILEKLKPVMLDWGYQDSIE